MKLRGRYNRKKIEKPVSMHKTWNTMLQVVYGGEKYFFYKIVNIFCNTVKIQALVYSWL